MRTQPEQRLPVAPDGRSYKRCEHGIWWVLDGGQWWYLAMFINRRLVAHGLWDAAA